MQLKNLKLYHLKNRQIVKDEKEGGRYEAFSSSAIPILANIYDKESKMNSSAAGVIREKQKIMLLDVEYSIIYNQDTKQEQYIFSTGHIESGDGVCVYVDNLEKPDYRISSITAAGHLVCQLEKI